MRLAVLPCLLSTTLPTTRYTFRYICCCCCCCLCTLFTVGGTSLLQCNTARNIAWSSERARQQFLCFQQPRLRHRHTDRTSQRQKRPSTPPPLPCKLPSSPTTSHQRVQRRKRRLLPAAARQRHSTGTDPGNRSRRNSTATATATGTPPHRHRPRRRARSSFGSRRRRPSRQDRRTTTSPSSAPSPCRLAAGCWSPLSGRRGRQAGGTATGATAALAGGGAVCGSRQRRAYSGR